METNLTPTHVVVIEFVDGQVGVVGPYTSEDDADAASDRIAIKLADDTGRVATSQPDHDTSTWTIGDPDDEAIWVYVSRIDPEAV